MTADTQYMIAPVSSGAVPESLGRRAAPLLCAGITTYNALRHSGAFPGDLVAVQGMGGLGHLGIQFANKFGYSVAAIGHGTKCGTGRGTGMTRLYRQRSDGIPVEALQKMGGAQGGRCRLRQAGKRCHQIVDALARTASSS